MQVYKLSIQFIKVPLAMGFIWFFTLLFNALLIAMITRLTIICYMFTSVTLILRLLWCFITLKMLFIWVSFILTWMLFFLFSFLSSLFFVSFQHLLKLSMLPQLLLLFLFFVQFSLFSFLFHTSSSPGVSVSLFILKYWFIIYVF